MKKAILAAAMFAAACSGAADPGATTEPTPDPESTGSNGPAREAPEPVTLVRPSPAEDPRNCWCEIVCAAVDGLDCPAEPSGYFDACVAECEQLPDDECSLCEQSTASMRCDANGEPRIEFEGECSGVCGTCETDPPGGCDAVELDSCEASGCSVYTDIYGNEFCRSKCEAP